MQIEIAEKGTRFEIRNSGEYVILTDDNCIWHSSDVIYFTQTGWDDYVRRRESITGEIDDLRNTKNMVP